MQNICRGKRVDNREWVEGYYVYDKHDMILENLDMRVRGTAELINAHVVSSNTVGRSTHKLDKNGVTIFEGDIVKGYGIISYIVRYGEFNGTVGLGYYYGIGFYIERIGDPTHKVPLSSISCDKGEYEVIGNIHDNKELLKVEEI